MSVKRARPVIGVLLAVSMALVPVMGANPAHDGDLSTRLRGEAEVPRPGDLSSGACLSEEMIGIDIVDAARLQRELDAVPGLRDRLFTHEELAHAETQPDRTLHLAGICCEGGGQEMRCVVSISHDAGVGRDSTEVILTIEGRYTSTRVERGLGALSGI